MVNISLRPDEVWGFYQQNATRLVKEMVEIAENEDTQCVVYLTSSQGVPSISVYEKDDLVYEEGAVSKKDAESTVKKIYAKYLPPISVRLPADSEDSDSDLDSQNTVEDLEGMIDEREDEILLAFEEFLTVLTEESSPLMYLEDDRVEEAIDKVVQCLAVDYGVRVRRPMFIKDAETHEEVFSEYPYEEYEFD